MCYLFACDSGNHIKRVLRLFMTSEKALRSFVWNCRRGKNLRTTAEIIRLTTCWHPAFYLITAWHSHNLSFVFSGAARSIFIRNNYACFFSFWGQKDWCNGIFPFFWSFQTYFVNMEIHWINLFIFFGTGCKTGWKNSNLMLLYYNILSAGCHCIRKRFLNDYRPEIWLKTLPFSTLWILDSRQRAVFCRRDSWIRRLIPPQAFSSDHSLHDDWDNHYIEWLWVGRVRRK